MKKSISILISFMLLSVTISGFAQDNYANMLIKKMVKTIRDPKNVELSFTYYTEQSGNSTQKQEGKAYMQGEQYKVVMNEQQTISDGNVIWSYLVEDQEVMISNVDQNDMNTPFKLISSLDRDYTAKLINTDKDHMSTIKLTNPKGQFKTVSVIIAKDGTLKNAEITADDSSKLIIDVTDMKTNQVFDDKFFTFDEKSHPEVEVIDMR